MAEINIDGDQLLTFVNAHEERLTLQLPMDLGRFARLLHALDREGFEFLEVVDRTSP